MAHTACRERDREKIHSGPCCKDVLSQNRQKCSGAVRAFRAEKCVFWRRKHDSRSSADQLEMKLKLFVLRPHSDLLLVM